MPRMKLIEQVNLSPSQNLDQVVREAFKGELPESLYPEIKAISASKVTRNKTFYSTESLIGDKSKGNGINSILFPYPIPIIKDHATGGGFLSSGSSPIYGRARYARFLKEDNGKGYVSVIPEITDPEAIKMILTERFLTVSIGVETESVHCSICNIDLSTGVECEHKKGNTYFIDGKPLEAYWKIGPVWFQEISFVTVPSDTDAQVINKNVKLESLKVFGGKMESGKEIFLESFAGYDDAKRMWSMPIKENKETINENINNSIEDEDRILTLGELYNLSEDDPEFSIEAKLNAKQRKALLDSSFCGPGRSFPAHDLTHTSVGLRLLGRYKGPGDKNRIKSCLLRKAASFRKKENSEHLALGYLRDEKFGVEFPLFKVNQSTIIPVFESLRNSLFPEETKIGMYKTLANICKKNKWYRPSGLEEIYQTIEISKEEYPPVIIELNKETYPLLYNFIDVIETQIWEDYMKDDINKDPKDEGIKEEIEKEKTEESNFNIEEIKNKIQEELENKYKKEYENKVKELEANSITQEQYEILNEKCIESYSVAHVRLAGQVAILAKVLRKPISKEKSIVDITREYSKRSTTSLEDTLSDLLLEYDGSTPVDIEKVEKVENPATIENERAISMIAIDPKTQKPTLVSDIKEEEDETFYLRYNIDPKRVEQRIKQHASSL